MLIKEFVMKIRGKIAGIVHAHSPHEYEGITAKEGAEIGKIIEEGLRDGIKEALEKKDCEPQRACYELIVRESVQNFKHMQQDANNYRKMHGIPMRRNGGKRK